MKKEIKTVADYMADESRVSPAEREKIETEVALIGEEMSDKEKNPCPMPRNGAAGGKDNEKAWNYAIGIVQVDGIKPSDDFMELVEREKRGEITSEDIQRILIEKYKQD